MPKPTSVPDVQCPVLALHVLPYNHEELKPLTSQVAISNLEELWREEVMSLRSQFVTSSLEESNVKDFNADSSQNATSSTRPSEARYNFEFQLNRMEDVMIMRSRSHFVTLKNGLWPNPLFRRNGFPS